jgi:hypothetical protein
MRPGVSTLAAGRNLLMNGLVDGRGVADADVGWFYHHVFLVTAVEGGAALSMPPAGDDLNALRTNLDGGPLMHGFRVAWFQHDGALHGAVDVGLAYFFVALSAVAAGLVIKCSHWQGDAHGTNNQRT